MTPLHWACKKGRLEVVAALIAAGASIEEKENVSPMSND